MKQDLNYRKSPGRCSLAKYARLLRCIHDHPGRAAPQLQELAGFDLDRLRLVLRRMMSLQLVHARETSNARRACFAPGWHIGPLPTIFADLPKATQPLPANKVLLTLKRVLDALTGEAQCAASLAEAIGMPRARAGELLNTLHELRIVFIEQWAKTGAHGGRPTRRFRAGYDKRDAPRPKPIDPLLLSRQRKKAVRIRDVQVFALFALAGKAAARPIPTTLLAQAQPTYA